MSLDDIYMVPLDYIDGTRIRRVDSLGPWEAPPQRVTVEHKKTLARANWTRNRESRNASRRAKRAAAKEAV